MASSLIYVDCRVSGPDRSNLGFQRCSYRKLASVVVAVFCEATIRSPHSPDAGETLSVRIFTVSSFSYCFHSFSVAEVTNSD